MLFTIKLWTLVWFIAFWVDNNLLLAMYPDTESLASFFGDHDISNQRMRMLLNILVGTMHILFPLLTIIIAGYAGVRLASATNLFLTQAGAYNATAASANRGARKGLMSGGKWAGKKMKGN